MTTVDSLVNSTSRWKKRKDFFKRFKLRIRSHDSFPEIWNFSGEKQLGKYYRKRNGNIIIISVCIFSAWLHDMNRRVLEMWSKESLKILVLTVFQVFTDSAIYYVENSTLTGRKTVTGQVNSKSIKFSSVNIWTI